MEITTICEVTSGGVEMTAVAVSGGTKTLDCLRVEGRSIRRRYLNDQPQRADVPTEGNWAILELDPRDKTLPIREMVGQPPQLRTAYREPKAVVQCGGTRIESSRTRYMTVEKFQRGIFNDSVSGNTLFYWLYRPELVEPGKTYPLVAFLHDGGSCSNDDRTGLLQGNGGTVWASEEWQQKHPCFVLVPHYPRQIVNDDCECTWEVEATARLIDALAECEPIDQERLYLTGQSMGAMTSCELLCSHPTRWAGAYLVAGQWDPERMAAAKDANIWYIVSEKDEKAYPGMKAIAAIWEREGERVVYGSDSATDPRLEENAGALAAEGGHLICATFTGDSVLSPGGPLFPGIHHISTWRHAYNVAAAREWLFAQRRNLKERSGLSHGQIHR